MGCKNSKPIKNTNTYDIKVKLDLKELEDGTIRTPLFSFDGHKTRAKCVKCYDADSVHLVFVYNNKFHRFVCRLNGIDAAEITSKDSSEKQVAIQGKQYLEKTILNKCVNINCYKYDKYGRILVDIYKDKKHINNILIKKNYAYEYNGKTKKQFSEWYQKK